MCAECNGIFKFLRYRESHHFWGGTTIDINIDREINFC